MAKNYYIILGVNRDASDADIRSVYRRLAKEYHPDHYGQDSGPFLQIQEAYRILGDPTRRYRYDVALRRPSQRREVFRDVTDETLHRKRAEPVSPAADGPTEVFLTRSFSTFTPSFDEIFDRLWNNFSSLEQPKSGVRRPLTVEIPLSPDQARAGGQVRVRVPAEARCPTCNGNGGVGVWECWRCAGEGRIRGEFPVVVDYPAGVDDGHATMVPLDRLGIRNTYLTVRFRVTGG